MEKIKTAIYCFFVLLISGCNSSKQNETEILVNTSIVSDVPFYKFVDHYKVIHLETKDNSIIGNHVVKIKICNERILILDWQTSSILIFNIDGKFLNKICHKGKGPGEYVLLTDFYIDTDKEQILALDNDMQKVIKYSINGDFISEKKIKFSSTCFEYLPKEKLYIFDTGNVLSVDNYNFNLLVTDSNFNVIAKYLDFKETYGESSGGLMSKFGNLNDLTTYLPSFSSNIYSVDKDYCKVLYHLNFDKPLISWEVLKQNEDMDFYKEPLSRYIFNYDYFNTDSLLFLTFMTGGKFYVSFYYKSTHKNLVFENADNAECCGPPIIARSVFKDYIVLEVSPDRYKRSINFIDPEQGKKIRDEKYDFSNPALILLKLK